MLDLWMAERHMILVDLTTVHLEQFWEEQQLRNLAPSTMYSRRCRLHKYLYWLHRKDLLRFTVDPPQLRHMRLPLPRPAKQFLKTPRPRVQETAVHALHGWLHHKRIELKDLTPAHFEAFLRRPICNSLVKSSRRYLHQRLEAYLIWLYEEGHIGFKASRIVRKAFPLPPVAEEFINTKRATLKSSSCGSWQISLRDLHAWLAFHNIAFEDIDRKVTEQWLKVLAECGLAAATRNGRIFHARSYFHWLFERGLISNDPSNLLRVSDLPKIPTYLPRPFPVDADREMQRRLFASGTTYGQALFLMRSSGVRIGELVHLDTACIDEDPYNNSYLRVPLGKLDNERLVPLNDRARSIALALQRKCSKGDRLLILPGLGRDQLKNNLSKYLKETAAGLDIPGPIVSHRLRHTYATELLNAGMSLIGVMRLLGHRSLRMTMRYAAITQQTVVKDYYEAMSKISLQYDGCSANRAEIVDEACPDPDRMLRDVISFLRNQGEVNQQIHRLITRVHKLRYEIANLDPQTPPS